MSAPPDVAVPLERLASHAPAQGLDPGALWTRGRRRQRGRALAALTAVVAVAVGGAAMTPHLLARAQEVAPVTSNGAMVLPDVIRQPGGWDPAFGRVPGRLSAVGFGQRSTLWSTRAAWWGVSATTGESRFLDLPGAADAAGTPVLSADGWRLAYWATGDVPGEPLSMGAPSDEDVAPVVGVAVLDLRTGDRDVWSLETEHGLATGGLAWAGDVLWWSAGQLSRAGETSLRGNDIVARSWDVTTDERDDSPRGTTRLGLAETGAAPAGFVEPRASRGVVVVSGTGVRRHTLRLPAEAPASAGAMQPTVSPDGRRLAALLRPGDAVYGRSSLALLVGPLGRDVVRLAPVAEVTEQGLLGWRSPTEVVAATFADVEDGLPSIALSASVVDVTSGETSDLLSFSGNTPQVAADAWAADIVPAPDAPFAPDPRILGLVLLLSALVGWRSLVLVRRRHERA